MAAFVDIEIFTDKNAAEVKAQAYRTGSQARMKVEVIPAGQLVVHDSRGAATTRVFGSGPGTFFILKSEA